MIPIAQMAAWLRARKPRASGDDPNLEASLRSCTRVNPARAGMIPSTTRRSSTRPCKPRASGDDPSMRTTAVSGDVGKPRASGDDPVSLLGVLHVLCVNPARAGMIQCHFLVCFMYSA